MNPPYVFKAPPADVPPPEGPGSQAHWQAEGQG
jgi:hypothetical protein